MQKTPRILVFMLVILGVFCVLKPKANATIYYEQPYGDTYVVFPTATSTVNKLTFTVPWSASLPGNTTVLYLYGGPTAGGLVGYETYCPTFSVTNYGGNYTGPIITPPWRYASFIATPAISYGVDSNTCDIYFRNNAYDLLVYGHYFGGQFYPAIAITDGEDPGAFWDGTNQPIFPGGETNFMNEQMISWAGTTTVDNGTQYASSTVGTSTLVSTTNLLSFLNIPRLLQEKVPFGYFFLAKDAIQEGLEGTSTQSIPIGTFDIKLLPTMPTTTVTLFSTSTVVYYLGNYLPIIRGLLVLFLYAEFLFWLYSKIRHTHLI